MKLRDLITELDCPVKNDNTNPEITGITVDSRRVQPGDLFICLKGLSVDRHDYADVAVQKGAVALIVERWLDLDIPQIKVENGRSAWAMAAGLFYNKPADKLKFIGVTGTNGKTTTAHMINTILQRAGKKTAVMGTVGTFVDGKRYHQSLTTPDPMEFHELLSVVAKENCEYVVMEVSAHALELHKVDGVRFETAVFTNLTQDHLDDFKTMDNYRDAKKKIFTESMSDRAVINGDDPAAEHMMANYDHPITVYAIDNPKADIMAENVKVLADGLDFTIHEGKWSAPVKMKMSGRFNAYNAMAAAGACRYAGVSWKVILEAVMGLELVEGRMENVDCGQDFKVLVDYSHTPDSLENAIKSVREFVENRLIVVFGCGGDRDKTKRPKMGAISGALADYSIITSDNPRTEEPESIIDMIEEGTKQTRGRYERICDRKEAIEKAIQIATTGDVVLIAGKGHETYQDVMGKKHHFDDREIARDYITRG